MLRRLPEAAEPDARRAVVAGEGDDVPQDAEAGEPAEIGLAGARGDIIRPGGDGRAEGRRARAAADQRRAAPVGGEDRRVRFRPMDRPHQSPAVAVAEVDDIGGLDGVGVGSLLGGGARADWHGGGDAEPAEAVGGVLRLVIREALGGGGQEGDLRSLARHRAAEEAEMEAVERLREGVAADEDDRAGHTAQATPAGCAIRARRRARLLTSSWQSVLFGVSSTIGRPARRGSLTTLRKPSNPIWPSPIAAWRSLRSPSGWSASLTCSALMRS